MKKFLILFLLLIPSIASAQYGGGFDVGQTTRHRFDVTALDTWFSNPNLGRSDDIKLDGYNKVRADFSVTGDSVSILVNLMTSNDTIWTSGDTLTVTQDSYKVWDLVGGKDYFVYVTSVSSGDRITVWLTPFNERN